MSPDHELTEQHIGLAAEIAFSINRLSAVPHEGWCCDAACLLSRIRPDATIAITVAQFDQSGSLRKLKCDGHHRSEDSRADDEKPSLRLSGANIRSLNWWIKSTDPAVAILPDLSASEDWTKSPRGSEWTRHGVNDMLIALSTLPGPNQQKRIAIEIGIPSDAPTPSGSEIAIVRGLLPLLAGRAGLAFNSHENGVMVSNREVEVLQHLSEGRSVKQIAERLGRSEHTIHDHVKSLHRKLGATSRGELIARALGHLSSTRAQEVHPGTRPSVPEDRASRVDENEVSFA